MSERAQRRLRLLAPCVRLRDLLVRAARAEALHARQQVNEERRALVKAEQQLVHLTEALNAKIGGAGAISAQELMLWRHAAASLSKSGDALQQSVKAAEQTASIRGKALLAAERALESVENAAGVERKRVARAADERALAQQEETVTRRRLR